MKAKLAPPVASLQWLPAERMGQMPVEPNVRPWLIGKGLLSRRMKEACGNRFTLRLVDQWTGLLSGALQRDLRVADNAALFSDVEMYRDDQAWIFAQTVAPDSTLCLHPWLAEMGDSALDETLLVLGGVVRSTFEYAWLPANDGAGSHPLAARALRGADIKPSGLWARRTRVALRGAPLLMQEVFLPAVGHS
ncbi:MAG: chorismate lyase [Pseudomonadota bacterium]|nr:chorismate lyase [Pseudomonadota bacterium]